MEADPREVARRKQLEHGRLERMVAYAETGRCLRATILRYFGDPAAREPCGACGNCRPHGADAHDLAIVRAILSGIAEARERYGRRRIVPMLAGEVADLPPSLAGQSTAGSLRREPPGTIGRWIDAAIAAGLVAVSADQYRTLGLTPLGRAVMHGRAEPLDLAAPARPQPFHRRRPYRRRL